MEQIKIIPAHTVVVGSGAAGFNAACRLQKEGVTQIAVVTEGVNMGTSRNTGSDKQTYYKLGLGGDNPDSVRQMAKDLFAGGSVDGDNALCEAALSTRCFLNLCELGVPFPVNRYGEYVGYKTDHDPYARATSVGPLTSKFMTEALEKQAHALQIPVYDDLLAVEILQDASGVCGLICMEKSTGKFVVFQCSNVILATGGPAGIYADSVYPESQTGSTGLALQAGASLQNMTLWQYGLASVAPRWNVSGTYMQVLPRFVSVDREGQEREFLGEYFVDPYEAMSAVFLKGYQWPFDSKKVLSGSSVIDLLVYRECVLRKRRVFLDFTKNPFGMEEIAYEKLSSEAYTYLHKAEAEFGTPIQRLDKMNRPAIALYRSKGVDIATQYLEIALCAQHNNGGVAVDKWWQTEVPGLFAAGECAGTHGISRPGGSALNAGQVGSLRAAQYISASCRPAMEAKAFAKLAGEKIAEHQRFCDSVLAIESNVETRICAARRRMSDCGAAIRDRDAMKTAIRELQKELDSFEDTVRVESADTLFRAYQLKDMLLVQNAVLTAMEDFGQTMGATCGSALYTDRQGSLREGLEEMFRFKPDTGASFDQVQLVKLTAGGCKVSWRSVRPIPEEEDVFETVWRQYRENRNIY